MKPKELSKSHPRAGTEIAIGLVLRYSVAVSSFVTALGVILSQFRYGSYPGLVSSLEEVVRTNFGRPALSYVEFAAGLSHLNPLSITQLGVLILLAIPFFRVAGGALMYATERDWKYVAISASVLAILVFSTFVIGPFEASK